MIHRWQIARHAAPAVRNWGDEYVVHHALSNDTYRLSATAGRILTGLMTADVDYADGAVLGYPMDDAEAETCLWALAELGLITQC
jgi:hypothetical protein